MVRVWGLFLATLLLTVSIGSSAHAAGKSKRGQSAQATRAKKAQALYQSGKFEAALKELQAAYAEKPDFELLFDIAQCERELKRIDAAARNFQAYLAAGGEKVSAERRSIVTNELAMIQEVTALVTIVVPGEPADVTIDSEAVGESPFRQPFYVSPGEHLISAFRQGQPPATRKVELVAGKRITVKLDPAAGPSKVTFEFESKPAPARVTIDGNPAGLAPISIEVTPGKHFITAEAGGYAIWERELFADKSTESQTIVIELEPEEDAPAPVRKGKAPVAGLVISGVGVLAIGASVALGVVAGIESREVADLFAQGGRWDAYYDARQASGVRAENWSILAGVGGGIVLATGLIVTLATLPSSEPTGEIEVESTEPEQSSSRKKPDGIEDPRVFFSPLKEGGAYGGLSFRF